MLFKLSLSKGNENSRINLPNRWMFFVLSNKNWHREATFRLSMKLNPRWFSSQYKNYS